MSETPWRRISSSLLQNMKHYHHHYHRIHHHYQHQYHHLHPDLLDGLQPLVVDVLPQLHREARGGGVLGPVELCGVEAGPGLDQQHHLLVWLLKLDEVGLVVYVVNLECIRLIIKDCQSPVLPTKISSWTSKRLS